MWLSIRSVDDKELYSEVTNNQNYIPPVPGLGDFARWGKEKHQGLVVQRIFVYDDLGLDGVTLKVDPVS